MKHVTARWLSLCSLSLALLVGSPTATAFGLAGTRSQDMFEQATEYYQKGRYIEAKQLLLKIDLAELELAERQGVFDLRDRIDEVLNQLPHSELQLRYAELSLSQRDLKNASARLLKVLDDPSATADQQREATTLLEHVTTLQEEVEPHVPGIIDDATGAFNDGQYGRAKAGFQTVMQSGIILDAGQQANVDGYLERIYLLEARDRVIFDLDTSYVDSIWGGADTAMTPQTPVAEVTTTTQEPTQETQPGTDAVEEVGQEQPTQEPAAQDEGTPAAETQEQPAYEPPHDLIYQAQQAQANEYLQQAIDAQAEGKYELAVTLYSKALTIQPENEMALQGKAQCETFLDRGSIIDDPTQDRDLLAQQLRAEYGTLLEQSRDYLTEGNYVRASDMVMRAKYTLSEGKNLISLDEYEALRAQAQTLGEEINQMRREEEAIEMLEDAQAAQTARDQQRRELEMRRQREIAEILISIRRLQQAQKYDEALLELERLLFMDPNNASAQALKSAITEIRMYQRWDKTQDEARLRQAEQSLLLYEQSLLPVNIVEYPEDWPDLSQRRAGRLAYLESEGDRAVLASLENVKSNIDFEGHALGEVLGYIAEVADINLDVDWRALENNFIDRNTPVNLKLNDSVSLRVVLERVLRQVGEDEDTRPQYDVSDGILTISTKERLQAIPETHVYDIRDLLINVPNFEPPNMDIDTLLERNNRRSMSDRVFGDYDDGTDYDTERLTREERVEKIRDILTTTIDRRSWEINGGDVGVIQELNGNLIITTTERNHRDISNLLDKLREIRSLQISVESRFLLVSEDFFEQIGFDLDVWWGGAAWDVASREDPNLLVSDMFYNKETNQFTPGPQRQFFSLYELRGQTNADGTPIFDANNRQAIEGVLPEAGFQQLGRDTFTPWSLQQNTLGLTESLFGASATSFAGQALAATPGLSYAMSYLDEIQVDLLIKATQADRRSVQLTSPRLTFFNGQRAFVQLTTTQFFVSDLNPIVGDASAGFDPQLTAVQDGIVLDVEGTVSADRRYVTMTVSVSSNTVVDIEETQVPLLVGGIIVESGQPSDLVQVPGTIQRPIVQTSQVNTTVNVPDRGTIMLGGQTIRNEIEMESGVPVLSKLPLINRFFTNRLSTTEEKTLLILIKPTVIIQQENEELLFPGLQDTLNTGGAAYGSSY
ncbi:MAG: hypothetical protein HND57_10760 [Planctomycetes bacterium]|nr:hypothetical protein [Planctomycetota bacterium]